MPYEAGTMYRSRMPKLNQVNWLIKTIQETNCQIQVARYHIQIARTRVQAWTETKNLKSSTQSNHIQIISQSQTEGLLTRHCSVLQLSPIVKSSPNIDYPIPRAQTITHIIVSFVPQPTIIANINAWCMYQWRRKVDIAILRANFSYQMKSNFLIDRGTRIFLFGIVFLNEL